MPTKKDLFDEGKKDQLLSDAIKKAKQKKSESFPFVYGQGKGGSMFVLDWKRQNDHGKLFLEMKGKYEKAIMGQARVLGDSAEIKIQDKKGGKIKPKDMKDCLKNAGVRKVKLLDEKGAEVTDEDEE